MYSFAFHVFAPDDEVDKFRELKAAFTDFGVTDTQLLDVYKVMYASGTNRAMYIVV